MINLNTRYIYLTLVIVGGVAFVFSLFSPLLSISEFYIFSDTLTIYSAMKSLFNSGEWLLFSAIFIFAFVLPLAKYILLFVYGFFGNAGVSSSRVIHLLEMVSKWAMLDIFIIAILIASIKLKSTASAQTHYGLYLFALSVLMATICTYYYKHILNKLR